MPKPDSIRRKGRVRHKDSLVIIPIRQPLAGFTRPMASLECVIIDTYHHFEVPTKCKSRKPIIFHTLGVTDKRDKHDDEGDLSTVVAS